MTGGDILVSCLKAQGVRTLFGMPGNQNIHIYDAVLRDGEIDHILVRHEQGAALMANGYARASGRVGVALTVPGPGASNASTGIVDAHTDNVPVLLVTGGTEVEHDGRDRSKCFHGLNQRAFFGSVVQAYERPESVEEIPAAVTRVFRALRSARPGPAVLELPTDIAAHEVAQVQIPDQIQGDRLQPDEAELRRVAEKMTEYRHPIIFAGTNVVEAGATEALIAFAEKLKAPVMLTRLGKGAFPDGHSLNLGHCQGKLSREAVKEADGLIAIGCRFTQIDTRSWTMRLPERRVQLDPDPGELGREYSIDAGASGDLSVSLPGLTELVGDSTDSDWASEVSLLRTAVTTARPPLPILSQIRANLPDDAIFSIDVTTIGYRSFDELPIEHPRTFLYPAHSVTLGFAFPAALGAAIARPDRRVVAFCGDGGYQMNACELATAVEHQIPLIVVVINDGSLSAIRGSQAKTFDGRTIDTEFHVPHLADAARAAGARALRVDDPSRFESVFKDIVGLEGPTVIEVIMTHQRDALIQRVPWLYPD